MISPDVRFVLKSLALPPGGFILLGVAGVVLWRRRSRLGRTLCSLAVFGLWLLSTPLIANAIGRATERYPPMDLAHPTPAQAQAQAVVILGGGFRNDAPEYGGDAPGYATTQRLIEGARVARVTGLPVLVSGSPREAAAMRRFLEEDLRTPVRWTEAASRDTRENALFSARILGEAHLGRIVLVTSSLHMARSVAEFRSAGLEVAAAPAEMVTDDTPGFRAFLPSVDALGRAYVALYEWGGDLVRGGA